MIIFTIWKATDVMDATHRPYSLYGQQPMLWMRHIDHIHYMEKTSMSWMRHTSIIYSLYGQQPMLWIRDIDHIFIIWITTDVMDETH